MGEDAVFVPREETLRTDEMVRLCRIFAALGINTIRLTGGEPLTRPNFMILAEQLGDLVRAGRLTELTLTTNGTRLGAFASRLRAAGIRRVNVSLDTLDRENFARITRHDLLPQVIDGIRAAQAAGIAVRVNTVVLAGVNDHEIGRLIAWCGDNGCDMSLIEAMPLGGLAQKGAEAFLSLDEVRQRLAQEWTFIATEAASAGPSRYVTVAETGRRLGFITPLSHGFCDTCNRVRLTCTGRLHLCLASEAGIELRPLVRDGNDADIQAAIVAALARKPISHDFAAVSHARPHQAPMWRLGG